MEIGKIFEEIDGKRYYVLTKNNTRRDILQVSENTRAEGTSWFDPILPSLSHVWHWELPRDFDKSSLEMSDNIIWDVFADNSPPRTGKAKANEIEYISYAESLYKVVQVAVQQNRLLFAALILFLLIVLYNSIK